MSSHVARAPERALLLVVMMVMSLSGCMSAVQKGAPTSAPLVADCGSADRGSGDLLKPGTLVLLGEFHGTAQIPQFVGRLACQASSRGLRVRVGLEIPLEEQAPIEAFLSSATPEDAKKSLLQGRFWARDVRDGRSSEAMLLLLSRLGDLRRSSADIAVFTFDGGGGDNRDALMAKNILAAIERIPADISIVLTGNLHAKISKGVPWNADFLPMGWHLLQSRHAVTALNNSYSGGSAWACLEQGACKEHQVKGNDRGGEAFVEVFPSPEDGYHGIFHVGPITASPPAVAPQ